MNKNSSHHLEMVVARQSLATINMIPSREGHSNYVDIAPSPQLTSVPFHILFNSHLPFYLGVAFFLIPTISTRRLFESIHHSKRVMK
jgi:hypothetical protein